MFKWKDEYDLGVQFVDEQHKVLFDIGNRVYKLLKSDMYFDKYDRIAEIIEELKNYAAFHFKEEEAYMASIGYRKFLSHKVEHDDFIKKFEDLDLENVDHRQDQYIMELLEFVFKWIEDHILVKDKLYTEK
ncbi:hemerythrin [Anaerosolibacter carboniphilus]|uniref:Bacteriohemerythrin n=1 Tax=Anaerosolibacter carboniphilus TaxID=1417629 RepID=A0A841KVT1_9FIRM|nr:hemerythrin family protein [Anaerosolibacter carboniphilus]MBB6217786.1 hemerythrin [Anaerosolibacter carboniphilus]